MAQYSVIVQSQTLKVQSQTLKVQSQTKNFRMLNMVGANLRDKLGHQTVIIKLRGILNQIQDTVRKVQIELWLVVHEESLMSDTVRKVQNWSSINYGTISTTLVKTCAEITDANE
jgi:hypothetical protein